MKYDFVMGIDPGLSGSIALITVEGVLIDLFDAPILNIKKGKNIYNLPAINSIFLQIKHYHAVIEKMQTMPPGFRAQASFSLGYSMGMYEAFCEGIGISYEVVISKKWQKYFGITGAKGNTKTQSYQAASKLFPNAELTGPRGGIKDGRSDALLIAEWGRRRLVNNES